MKKSLIILSLAMCSMCGKTVNPECYDASLKEKYKDFDCSNVIICHGPACKEKIQVCGCDGVTYQTFCEAADLGMKVAYSGKCK